MERQKTATFETPGVYINCYGPEPAIDDLLAFWELHSEREHCINIPVFIDRVLMHNVQAFVIGKDFAGKVAAKGCNKRLENAGLHIDGGRFSLLAFFWNREFAAKRLGLTDAQTERMMDALKGIYYPDEDFDWREI